MDISTSCGYNEMNTSKSTKKCCKCGKMISSKHFKRHELGCGILFKCSHCSQTFKNKCNGLRHEAICIGLPDQKKIKIWEPRKSTIITGMGIKDVVEYESAFNSRLRSWFFNAKKCTDLSTFLQNIKENVVQKIQDVLKEYTSVKLNIVVECVFQNVHGEETDRAFKTKNRPIFQDTNVGNFIESLIARLVNEKHEAQMKGSGWSLKCIDGLRLRINKHSPLKGSSFIPLPEELVRKKACINVRNADQKCFMYSILAKMVDENAHRVSKYINLQHPYDFSVISFPTHLSEIKKFEKANKMTINVFGLESDNKLYPLKVVKEELMDHRDLLLLQDDKVGNHYVYIKDFNKLIGNQLTKHEHSIVVCKRCFSKFDNQYGRKKEEKLVEHLKYCKENRVTRVDMPIKKPYLEFQHVERHLRIPYVIYADFETILQPNAGCQPNPEFSYSKVYNRHVPMSYCVYVKQSEEVCGVPNKLPTAPYVYRGEDCVSHFVQYLKGIAEEISRLYSLNELMAPLTDEEQTAFISASTCYLCNKPFGQEKKVRDHCHITSKYRGAAHESCNLRCQNPSFIPVLLHNLSGYDGHFIVKELGYDDHQIDVIPNSEEKYISFSKSINGLIKLRFLDSFRFMPSSLDTLVRNLPHLSECEKFFNHEHISLLSRKGVFPYEYVTDWNKLDDTSLPPIEKFYSQLSDSNISEEDYQHAQKVWKSFEIRTLGEYSDHYLMVDVLQLTDVFENFRTITLKNHKLDPCHYFTTPGLTFDAMLKYTNIRLQLLTDYDKILMLERGIRGGICQVSHRYAVANNQYYKKEYNSDLESTYITYQDCTNLYGYAMSKPLPYGQFQWILPEEINLDHLKEDDEVGYILDVDIEYPSDLHNKHNDLPFLPESMAVNNQKKLIPHLGSRINYIVHYMALKQALDHGLKLIKINRVLKFKQSRWLSPYVNFNAELRKKARNNFEKDFFKLMNNAIFGKTMENIRNRINIQLVSDCKKMERLIARPDFIDRTILGENLVAVHMAKRKIVFNKPIYVGMSILDISKTVMYRYHYDVMLQKYSIERLKLCYMDTDSFIYLIKTDDLYADMEEMLDHLDTSDLPLTHRCYSAKNKKVMGTFKDEACGKIIRRFIGLRPKMYAVDIEEEEIKKIKGIQKTAVKNSITLNDYKNCLFSKEVKHTRMSIIQSRKHDVTTVELNKVSLSPFDDKRVILQDGIHTLAYGHRDVRDRTSQC